VKARRGIALIAALELMTLLGLFVAGAFAASVSGERSSRLVGTDAQLSAAADYAVNAVLGDPGGLHLAELALGQAQSYRVTIPGAPDIRASVAVTRFRHGVLWMTSDVFVTGVDQGHHRVNLVARFPSLGATAEAGVVAGGNVVVDSVEFAPDTTTDPECTNTGAPDVVVAPGSTIAGGDGARTSERPSAADSATYYLLPRQLALIDSSASIVHVHGDTTIAGGTFSGIIVADGSITVTGPFAVTGLLVARGSISAIAGGLSITGAMLAFGVNSGSTPIIEASRAIIRFSPCAITTALRLALHPKPVVQRSWAELF
jgi:hypothetical protein